MRWLHKLNTPVVDVVDVDEDSDGTERMAAEKKTLFGEMHEVMNMEFIQKSLSIPNWIQFTHMNLSSQYMHGTTRNCQYIQAHT